MRVLAIFVTLLGSAAAADLLVGAASDLAPLAPALQSGFAKATGQRVVFTFASSGSLARQIENGAPFDVFLAASEQYVRDLAAPGHVDASTVTLYAFGRVALWSANGSVHELADLAKAQVKHLAIPNPAHAPYGIAARQALEHQGLWKAVEQKVVYGENVRQALQFAESGNADAVITSWTLLKGRGMLLPSEWHNPIRQTGAIVKTSTQADSGKRFLTFLTSPAGQQILEDGGLFRLAVAPAAITPGSPASPPPARRPSAARRAARPSPPAR